MKSMKKRTGLALLLALMLITASIAHGAVEKDETIYGLLNSDGTVDSLRVVNYLYGSSDQDYYIDYGNYTSIKNLVGSEGPQVKGNEIRWPMDLIRGNGLYYEGTIDKKLPITIDIHYYLDGIEMKAADLAGKKGSVKIEIGVSFNQEEQTLMAQIQFTLNQDIFSNIVTTGSRVLVGKSANISFVALPSTEKQIFTVEMEGEAIELEPINITLLPVTGAIPAGIQGEIDQITDGLLVLEESAVSLSHGASEIGQGLGELQMGIERLGEGMKELGEASGQIEEKSNQITEGMENFHQGLIRAQEESSMALEGIKGLSDGLDQLTEGSKGFQEALGGLPGGLTHLNNGIAELNQGVQNIYTGHGKLVELAVSMANHRDPKVRALAAGILEEAKALEGLKQGMEESSQGLGKLQASTKEMKESYDQFHGELTEAAKGTLLLTEELAALPRGIKTIEENFSHLKTGTNALLGGQKEITRALRFLGVEVGPLPPSIKALKGAQKNVTDGINQLTQQGIRTMRVSMEEALDKNLFGASGGSYGSFVDGEKNKNARVQFILRTSAIKASEESKEGPMEMEEVENKGFLQRILDLFRKK